MSTDADGSHLPRKPTCVADLETLIIAEGRARRKAHIPDQQCSEPAPLCNAGYPNETTWRAKENTMYPAPDEWLTLCKRCLNALDREVSADA
jgi:hypothetical protein